MKNMSNAIKNLVNTARRFTAADFAVFKICLLAVGILLGAYFSAFFLKYITVVWIAAAITALTLIIQVIRYFKRPKN